MAKPPALLMFSGGLDSTRCAHDALKSGRRLHLHHIYLENKQQRARAELAACDQIVAWFRDHGYGHDQLSYTVSTFDYGGTLLPEGAGRDGVRFVTWDHQVYGLWVGILLAAPEYKQFKRLIRTDHQGAANLERRQVTQAQHDARVMESLHGIAHIVSRRKPIIERPLRHLTKAQVIAGIPRELRRLAWYCRRPRHDEAGHWTTCGTCHTCRQVHDANEQDATL